MIKVYKLDTLQTYYVSPELLTMKGNTKGPVACCVKTPYSNRTEWIIPIPKTVQISGISPTSAKGSIGISNLINAKTPDFSLDSKIFFHSNCTIPRTKVAQKYTRVINANKADICVVPNYPQVFDTIYAAIFINRASNKIYVIKSEYDRNGVFKIPNSCEQYPLGTSVLDINPSLAGSHIDEHPSRFGDYHTQKNWEELLNSVLIYCGNITTVPSGQEWIGDYLYNKIHDVIPEDKILTTLGDSSNEITTEIYNNICEMLNSTDSAIVGLGLKTLAELDYTKYYNTAIYLLTHVSSNWTRNSMKNLTTVKYMLKALDQYHHPKEIYSKQITIEDFNMLKHALEVNFRQRVNNLIENFSSKFPFSKLDFEYSFNVGPVLTDSLKESDKN